MKDLNNKINSLINKNSSFEVSTSEGQYTIEKPLSSVFKEWFKKRERNIKIALILANFSAILTAPIVESLNTKKMIDNTNFLNTSQELKESGLNVNDVFHDTLRKASHLYLNNEEVNKDKLTRITEVIYKHVDSSLSGKENYQILRDKDLILADIASKNGISKESVKNTFLPEIYNQSVKAIDDLQNIESKVTKTEKMFVLMKAAYNPFVPANIRYDSAIQLKDILKDKDILMNKDFVATQNMMLAQTLIKLSSDVKASPEIKVKSVMELQNMLNEEVSQGKREPDTSKNNKY